MTYGYGAKSVGMRIIECLMLVIAAAGACELRRRSAGGVFVMIAWCCLWCAPVAWLEGRWMYWYYIKPQQGELLASLEARLGRATKRDCAGSADHEDVAIRYAPPFWWGVPSSGLILAWLDNEGRVARWSVTWR